MITFIYSAEKKYTITNTLEFSKSDMIELYDYFKYVFNNDLNDEWSEDICIAAAYDNILKAERNNDKRFSLHKEFQEQNHPDHMLTVEELADLVDVESAKRNAGFDNDYKKIRRLYDDKCAEAILYHFSKDQLSITNTTAHAIKEYETDENLPVVITKKADYNKFQ